MINKKNAAFTVLFSVASVFPGLAAAENFPERPIELIVPYGAGGTTDVFARSLVRVVSKFLPNQQKVVVVNKPGGATTIGLGIVAAAETDGYTLALTPSGSIEVMPHYGRTDWTLDSFEPVLSFLDIPVAINVLTSSDLKSYADWKQFVDANPGKFHYATSGGTGSSTHLAMEMFSEIAEIDLRHIPFEGQAASQAALLGGQVMGVFSIPDTHKGGEVNPLVFLSEARPLSEVYDDVPHARDVGIPFNADFPMGILAPKGVDAERIKIIHDAFKKALDEPAVIAFFNTSGLPIIYRDSEAFAEGIRERSVENKRLMTQLGLIK